LNLKQAARDDLAALLPTGDKNTDKRFEKAMERVDQSLNPAWWATASTLDAQTGNHVFDRERQAVNELQKVLTGSFAEAAQPAIDKLVEADRQLAQVALNIAITSNGDSSRIAKAQEEMAQAAQETANGDFDQALQHYKKAWTEAIKAL
ncbi:MAG: hypothetical protein H6632_23765, partial [Anaerolineales bacterium]|nr:hypothetical protein [Anaerolineales bacterium]